MKRFFALILLAGLMTTACNVSEVTDVSVAGEIIEFLTATDGATKALDVTTANLTTFRAEAFVHASVAAPYFSNVAFTKSGSTYVSASPYYWPTVALDFYAWSAGTATGQVSQTDFRTFTVTPAATPAAQVDLVFACVTEKTKALSAGGAIPLNFRHTGSKVIVKVKNTAPNIKFEVTGWKVGYLDTDGTFTYNGNQANAWAATTEGAGTFARAMWTGNTTFSAANSYVSDFTSSAVAVAANTSTSSALPGEMILVPQVTTAATAYASSTEDAAVNGSYIGIELKIMNNDAAGTLIQPKVWAIWPVALDWNPGMCYTYTVDLAGGGYFPQNTDDGNPDLDPVLEGAEIMFATVTVDTWTNQAEQNLTAPGA